MHFGIGCAWLYSSVILPVVFIIIIRNFLLCLSVYLDRFAQRNHWVHKISHLSKSKQKTNLLDDPSHIAHLLCGPNTWDHHANCQQPLSPCYKLCNRLYSFCHGLKTIWPLVQQRTFVICDYYTLKEFIL